MHLPLTFRTIENGLAIHLSADPPSAKAWEMRTLTRLRCERHARTVPQAWQRHRPKRVAP